MSVVRPGRPPRHSGRGVLACTALLLFVLAPGEALAAAIPGADAATPTDTTRLPDAVRNGAETVTETAGTSSGGAFVRLIVGLFIVIAVIFGVYWLLTSYNKSKKGGAGSGSTGIDVVTTAPLGPNRNIHLVRVGDELLLVGSAEQAITRLRTYTPEQSRRLEQHLEGSGAQLRPLSSGSTAGLPPLARLVEGLRRRTIR